MNTQHVRDERNWAASSIISASEGVGDVVGGVCNCGFGTGGVAEVEAEGVGVISTGLDTILGDVVSMFDRGLSSSIDGERRRSWGAVVAVLALGEGREGVSQ